MPEPADTGRKGCHLEPVGKETSLSCAGTTRAGLLSWWVEGSSFLLAVSAVPFAAFSSSGFASSMSIASIAHPDYLNPLA